MNWSHPRSLRSSISMWDSSGTHHPLGGSAMDCPVVWIMDVGLTIGGAGGMGSDLVENFQAEGKRFISEAGGALTSSHQWSFFAPFN